MSSSVFAQTSWSGLTAAPPNGNAAAPLNISATAQTKNGNLGVNGLAVFGNTLLGGGIYPNAYLNFGTTSGSSGYGFWDNAGIMNYKDSGGSWIPFASSTFTGPYLPVYTEWSAQGTGSGGAAIYNDNGSYNTLMIVGNNSGGGNREVKVWDDLSVSDNLLVGNQETIQGTLNLNTNQVWNTTGPLYLQYGGPNDSYVSVGGAGDFKGLRVPHGNICLNGVCITSWPAGAGTPTIQTVTDSGNSTSDSITVEGTGIGYVSTGYYGDGTNLAARFPSGSGDFYVQSPGGGTTYMLSGAGQGGTYFPTGNVWANAFLYASDERLKKDIEPLTGNLAAVLALQPVSYQWIDPSRGTGEQLGFIAQQVQKVVPELVHTDASTTIESLDYSRITPLLVGSVQELNQELNQKIDAQDQKIDTQQQEIDALQADIAATQNK